MIFGLSFLLVRRVLLLFVFFFNDTATTEIYTLSLHDALPISLPSWCWRSAPAAARPRRRADRKSTRLNSSHANISYAVFCLKKKKQKRLEQYKLIQRKTENKIHIQKDET